jgi:hypothetical protein
MSLGRGCDGEPMLGDFRLILRMCQPRPEAPDGTFVLPPIRRVG